MTIYDLAKICGVSPSTISKALNNYSSIPKETRDKIMRVAIENHYVINNKARIVASKKTYCIGLIIKSKTKNNYSDMMRYHTLISKINEALNKDGYNLIILKDNKPTDYINDSLIHPNDGLVILGNGDDNLQPLILNYPYVSFSWNDYIDSDVLLDNEEKSFELTEHLIFNSHKNIVLIIDNVDSSETKDRIVGFKRALSKHNVPFKESMIFNVSLYKDDITGINELIKKCADPSGMMFPSDLSAIRYSMTLRRVGIDIPQDVSITGFGGFETESLLSKKLTSIRSDISMVANALEKVLLDRINGVKNIERTIIKSTLVLGETTSFARSKKV